MPALYFWIIIVLINFQLLSPEHFFTLKYFFYQSSFIQCNMNSVQDCLNKYFLTFFFNFLSLLLDCFSKELHYLSHIYQGLYLLNLYRLKFNFQHLKILSFYRFLYINYHQTIIFLNIILDQDLYFMLYSFEACYLIYFFFGLRI